MELHVLFSCVVIPYIQLFHQLFLRDSEQIEAATGAEEAFLSNDDLGVSLRDMCSGHLFQNCCLNCSEMGIHIIYKH